MKILSLPARTRRERTAKDDGSFVQYRVPKTEYNACARRSTNYTMKKMFGRKVVSVHLEPQQVKDEQL